MKPPSPPFHILCIEDNPGDVELVREALSEFPVALELTTVANGIDALAFCRAPGSCADLILLDLNLPKMDGREVLAQLKNDPTLRHIPVVVITSSEAERDLLQTYQSYANCYVAKPVDLHEFFTVVQEVVKFWLLRAKLPPRPEHCDETREWDVVGETNNKSITDRRQ
ncbi:MAG: response regulator [Acidobacteria bacterium]|nr:response regulator [Acidobacteriota bacterium]